MINIIKFAIFQNFFMIMFFCFIIRSLFSSAFVVISNKVGSSIWISHLLNTKYYSNECKTKTSFKHFCSCKFAGARFFIIFISSSVNLPCLSIPGSVSDKSIINERSCLTSPTIVEKYCSIYLFNIFSIMESSSF